MTGRGYPAARARSEFRGAVGAKTLYAAAQRGQLKVARIGSGRNIVTCEQFIDEYLLSTIKVDTVEAK